MTQIRLYYKIFSNSTQGFTKYFIFEIFTLICFLFFDIISPYLYKMLVDKVFTNGEVTELGFICFLMIWLFLTKYIVKFIKKRNEIKFEDNLQNKMRHKIMFYYLHKANKDGEFLKNYNEYVELFSSVVRKYFLESLFNILTVCVMAYITFSINYRLFLFSIIAILISLILNKIYSIKIKNNAAVYREKSEKHEEWIVSILQNINGLLGIDCSTRIINTSREKEQKIFSIYTKERIYLSCLEILQDFNYRFVMEMSLYFFGGYLILENQLLLGTFLAFVSYFKKMFNNMRQLGQKNINYEKEKSILYKICDIYFYNEEKVRVISSQSGDLLLHNIFYKYSDNQGFSLLVENLKIDQNDSIAVVGKSGSGKSTLARIISNEINNYSGLICFINQEGQLSLNDVLPNCVRVEKEPYFFNLSVIDNLALVNDLNDICEIERVIKLCFSQKEIFELGLFTNRLIGKKGEKLSGGQKERLNIARVLLLNPDLIIWDESTSQIDINTERMLFNNLKATLKQKTQIFIAHRKEILNYVNNVIYIDKGRIVGLYSVNDFIKKTDCTTLFNGSRIQ